MSEAQIVYATLKEVDKLLGDIEVKISNITGEKTSSAGGGGGSRAGGMAGSLRTDVRMLNIAMVLLERSTGNADVTKATQKIRALAMTAVRAKFAVQALQGALIPGAGWFSVAYAGFNMAALGMTVYDATFGM